MFCKFLSRVQLIHNLKADPLEKSICNDKTLFGHTEIFSPFTDITPTTNSGKNYKNWIGKSLLIKYDYYIAQNQLRYLLVIGCPDTTGDYSIIHIEH